MKTSLVSSAADIVKADQPQQLKSVTVYWRGRKMVLMQRPQRRLPALLCRMLRRSWQNLFGTLIKTIGAGAMAAAALTAQAHGSAELPTGFQLVDGQARMWQHHNHMTVKQASESAIIDWQSFSIGAGGSVRFIQNDANAVALNRVLGNDPSVIMGSLTANGKIFLINAAGILVGKTGKIDVAGFTASTLDISDADFKAGKMNFAADPGKTIGDVQNIGMIKTKEGGSVYLIGASVENDGVISAPNGQVLLAAGSMVKLVDTSLPGVSIEVSGVDGKVTNLGQIIASAGTIGIGAALIDDSGIINASSVEKEGGRIFLRATKQLTTDATSQINADGTTGGNVQLYSDQVANIDGDVSALGSAGNGGFVDTSGKTSLSVKYVPRVGPGGQWYIDPSDILIDDSAPEAGTGASGGVITSDGSSSPAVIHAQTIEDLLNSGTSVDIITGASGIGNGDITVNAAIAKTDTTHSATLTLDAFRNININAGISDASNSGVNGLSLILNAGFDGSTTSTGAISNLGGIVIGGNLTAHSASFDNSKMLLLNGGTATFSSDLVNNTNGTIAGVGTINMNGHTLINNAGVVRPGSGAGTGLLTVNGNYQQNATGTLQSSIGRVTGLLAADQLKVNGNVNLAGKLQMTALEGYSPQAGDKVSVLDYSGTRTGHFDDSTGIFASNLSVNYLLLDTGADHNVAVAYVPSGDSYFTGGAGTLNWDDAANWFGGLPLTSADVYMDTGDGHTVFSAINRAIRSLTIASGEVDVASGLVLNVTGSVSVSGGVLGLLNGGTLNAGALAMSGGTFNANDNFTVSDLNISGGQINGATGKSFSVNGNFAQSGGTIGGIGSARIDIGSFTQTTGNLVVANINAGTNLVLNAENGAISQTVGTSVISNALSATAENGITLNNAGNNVGAFVASNALSGKIIFNDAAVSLLLNGNINNHAPVDGAGSGNIAITNTGGIIATAIHGEGGSINGIDSSGTVALTSTGGNVTLGRVNAANLNVSAAGNISQESTSTGALTISNMMTANASSGITLDHGFGSCGSNRIAFFGASNTGGGDITLVNSDSDGVTDHLVAINNLGGNISVNNTGALETGADLIKASGTVTIATHSPLTIGSGGLTAGNGVTLTAGDGTSAADVLTLNGAVQATTGAVTFGGNTVFENAAVISLAPPVIPGPNPPVLGLGHSQSLPTTQPSNLPDNSSVNNQAANNQAANNQAANTASTTTDATTTKTSQTNLSDTSDDVVTLPAATATNSTSNTAPDQTAGGSAGEFGGGDSKDEKKDSDSKSGKPMPVCS